MKKPMPLYAALCALAVAAFAGQSPQSALQTHNATLAKAKSAKLVLTVQPIPGVPVEQRLVLAKPAVFRFESGKEQAATDGKTLWTLDPAKNEYTESPLPEGELARRLASDTIWIWGGFFGGDPFKGATNVQMGGRRNIKGTLVTEVSFTTPAPNERPVTAYFDAKTGLLRGFSMKSGGSETLVLATDIQLGESADGIAAFTPPAGAVKVEKPVDDSPTFADIQPILVARCMPCHGADERKGRLDLSTYQTTMAAGRGQVVVPGKPDQSLMIQYIRGERQPQMPQNAAPLSEAEIAKLVAWIAGGAKG